MTAVGRLAPTPSGHLHLGNALAFVAAMLSVRARRGRLLLRIEDLDRGRARPEIAEAQREELRWLGIVWDEEVAPQSRRAYALGPLPTYRCACSRALRLERRCRCRDQGRSQGVWRFRTPPGAVSFVDRARGPQRLVPEDDPVVMRADGEAAYPLAVVIDDARDGVTEVVRGADLLDATAAQLRIHEALALGPPSYLHVPLLVGPDGRKLSKSHGSTELRALRRAGVGAAEVWALLLPLLGLPPRPPAGLGGGRTEWPLLDPARIPAGPFVVDAAGRVVG